MISWALLGIVQALILPGFILSIWIGKQLNLAWQDKFLIATPLSIVFNYALVSGMVWADMYVSAWLNFIILAEIFALLIYALKVSAQGCVIPPINPHIALAANRATILLALQIISFSLLFTVYLKFSWSVFTEWDAVVSWNRWAKEWFAQKPSGSVGYPPGLPILYSLVYKAAGTIDVQTLAKTVAAYFPFFGIFCLWRIGSLDKRLKSSSIIAGLIYIFLMQRGNGGRDFVFSGYTDPVMASLGAFSLYALVLIRESVSHKRVTKTPDFLAVVSALFALVACAVVKQSGVILAALTVLCALFLCRQYVLKRPYYFSGLLLIAGAAASNWYIYSYFTWNDFFAATDLMSPDLLVRMYNAMIMSARICTPYVLVAMVLGLLVSREARLLAAFLLLPLWLFWALVVSYDFRTAFYMIPVIAFIAALGFDFLCKVVGEKFRVFYSRIKMPGTTSHRVIIVGFVGLAIILLILPRMATSERLLSSNEALRLQSNNEGFNQEALEIFARSTPDQKMLSCWQMLYNLPGAEGKFIPYGNCDTGYKEWIARRDVKYFIFWEPAAKTPHDANEVRTEARSAGVAFKERVLANGFLLFEKLN